MNKFPKHPILSNIIYWTISTLLIIILFVIAFGVIGPIIMEHHIDYNNLFSIFFILVGTIMILLAILKPKCLYKIFIKENRDDLIAIPDIVGLTILGSAFIFGGLIYKFTNEIGALIIIFMLGAIVIRVRAFLKK